VAGGFIEFAVPAGASAELPTNIEHIIGPEPAASDFDVSAGLAAIAHFKAEDRADVDRLPNAHSRAMHREIEDVGIEGCAGIVDRSQNRHGACLPPITATTFGDLHRHGWYIGRTNRRVKLNILPQC
jgi:hypothetical protein